MSSKCTNICVMVLCGLPAAGKTSLTSNIQVKGNQLSETDRATKTTQGCLEYLIVEYDKILPEDVEKDLLENRTCLNEQTEILSPWKQYRLDIYTCLDVLLGHLTADMTCTDLKTIQKPEHISCELWDRFQKGVISQLLGRADNTSKICLVIDDNMYYRSMRYMFYQLARKYNIGYCQLYLSCDVNEALRRNSSRTNSVPNDVIISMETKFEEPDTTNSWEKLSLSSSVDKITREMVDALVEEAMSAPVPPLPQIDEEAVTQSRQICSANFLHQSDQILRKLVSQEISQAKDMQLSKSAMKEFASRVQLRRKELLEGLKSSKIVVPAKVLDSVIDSSKDENSPVYNFIKALFQSHQGIK